MTRVIHSSDREATGAAIDAAVAALENGGVIAIPTETVYGVAALPNEAALERLLLVKRRSPEKGIQLLVDSIDQVSALAILTPAAQALASRFWPGGLTIVLARRQDIDVPNQLGGGRPTLGFRLPDNEIPRALARRLGPIAASSANISGEPDATDAQRVQTTLGEELDLIIDGGPVRGGVPSTVVDCSDPTVPPKVLRKGAISTEDIAAAVL
ncbi:MAG: L-threonylcarbamoyladenylate synthase [Candidatus Limnocylindrales bacterium]